MIAKVTFHLNDQQYHSDSHEVPLFFLTHLVLQHDHHKNIRS